MTRNITSATRLTEMVTVRFRSPVSGIDPIDGCTYTADRHRVAAVTCRQDAVETVFIDDEGEIVARWPTETISQVDWPGHGTSNGDVVSDAGSRLEPPIPFPVGSKEWHAAVKRQSPRAYAPWSRDEDNDLREEYDAGLSVASIAKNHQRRIGAIESRLRKLELL